MGKNSRMKTTTTGPDYRGYRFPPEIISHAVWLYFRFSLSFHDVEELLAQCGIAQTAVSFPCEKESFVIVPVWWFSLIFRAKLYNIGNVILLNRLSEPISLKAVSQNTRA